MKKYCCVCGRQFVDKSFDNTIMVGKHNAVIMGTNEYCCYECAKDLDENGMFPEERKG